MTMTMFSCLGGRICDPKTKWMAGTDGKLWTGGVKVRVFVLDFYWTIFFVKNNGGLGRSAGTDVQKITLTTPIRGSFGRPSMPSIHDRQKN